ncbi:MAG: hypothetical protein IIZ51_05425 [Lachnospiraceae bacterium]|nr:hypothetical protein [Lachnospiraceae bacterium]MBQ1400111.1 hypothetical protein [Lachnospiraceae bacterium]MBQ1515271.1 hypothetical protein [Lachnospiraceae bacterium]MBQ4309437.1 hypothetical protein [Lachnospiraceae bacterium]
MARKFTLKRDRHLLGAVAVRAVITLDGVKLGELKNGEEKSWDISEERHFLIVTSKGAINEGNLEIPAGKGDLSLALGLKTISGTRSKWYFPGVDGELLWWQPRGEINNPLVRYLEDEKKRDG